MDTMLRTRTLVAGFVVLAWAGPALADETCNSPYTTRLIKGQEDYVHVWTLGVAGVGDGSDKPVTIDANPKSKGCGKVVHTLSVERGGIDHPQKSALIAPLGLTAEERAALVAFLRKLTGSGVTALAAEARRVVPAGSR